MREFRGAFHVKRAFGIRTSRRQLDQAGSEFP